MVLPFLECGLWNIAFVLPQQFADQWCISGVSDVWPELNSLLYYYRPCAQQISFIYVLPYLQKKKLIIVPHCKKRHSGYLRFELSRKRLGAYAGTSFWSISRTQSQSGDHFEWAIIPKSWYGIDQQICPLFEDDDILSLPRMLRRHGSTTSHLGLRELNNAWVCRYLRIWHISTCFKGIVSEAFPMHARLWLHIC